MNDPMAYRYITNVIANEKRYPKDGGKFVSVFGEELLPTT